MLRDSSCTADLGYYIQFLKKLEKAGFVFERHRANHDIYAGGTEKEEIPGHKEMDERLARVILKRNGL